ncbi:hypothetical protein HYH03_018016 [Edaphochlamys debaryana]|uniref:OCRE domain-containing protein n=1 Tax=Edaphochlamys debaryana TaxID=47281 RepID=A0A835XIW4_9CHLO|nr:hypothetical protein HYH03_018016 [Edaphochlamys debaryana]|eukprot:KAG2483126.1 hypothetical protein HYH03_018016 [Edaphochlamys debaryana]
MKFPTAPDVEKRERDEPTDTLIKSLLDEEQASKKQKRGDVPDVAAEKPARKAGKTLAEIEQEEGGPVKESLVGMAQTKRALDRKKKDAKAAEDTEVVDAKATERYEKELEVEEEDGVQFEPFNLKQEREEGFFDDEGNYVYKKQGEGEDEKDAWLNSDEAKVVSEAVRQRLEKERAAAAAEPRQGPLTERQIAQRKADMAECMQPGEDVTRALKRLGQAAGGGGGAAAALPHRAMGKREKARLLAQQQAAVAAAAAAAGDGDGAAAAEAEAAQHAQQAFTKLTELADELLAEGEMDIYSSSREELLRSARMWLPQLAAGGAAPVAAGGAGGSAAGAGPSGSGGAAAAAAAKPSAAVDADDDMFGDEDDEGAGKAKGGAAAAVAAAAKPSTAVDADDDMFGDDEEEGKPAAKKARTEPAAAAAKEAAPAAAVPAPGPAAAAKEANGAAGPGPGSAAAKEAGAGAVDYASWPIKELKRLLKERGIDSSSLVEKGDLVARVQQAMAEAPQRGGGMGPGGPGGAGGAGSFDAPPGYRFDPGTSYFYNEDTGMYFDPATGAYGQAATNKWFYLDPATGSFVEWKAQ